MSGLLMLAEGFASIFHPSVLLMLLIGVFVGIVFGAIPGLSASMAVALFLPMTYEMDTITGLCTLVALYIGGVSGGLISAILIKMPGTSGSVATTFDGYPMARNGNPGKALGVALVSSFCGSVFSFIILIFLAPQLARFALKFSPVEYFSVIFFAVTMVSSLAGKSMIKGLIVAVLGLILSTVGIAPIDGTTRFTFGNLNLAAGFSVLPALIGLFAVSEVFALAEHANAKQTYQQIPLKKIKGFGFTLKEFWGQKWNLLRSMLIGLGIGILPGIGDTASNMLAYTAAKNSSKEPEKFGTGIIDGIIPPEAANNASIGGALIPLLALGIPGDGVTALILSGFMLQGLVPGPLLFTQQSDLVYCIFATCMIGIVIVLIMEYFGMRVFVKLLKIPKYILMPIIISLCVVGAFATNNNLFDTKAILLFGAIGYAMKKFDLPVAPFVLTFVLGNMLETNFKRGLMLTNGSFLQFFTHPIAAVFMAVALLSVVWSVVKTLRRRKTGTKA